MWVFRELNCDYIAIFSNEEKANEFVKSYAIKMYDENGCFPDYDIDYILNFYETDPDISKVDKFFA